MKPAIEFQQVVYDYSANGGVPRRRAVDRLSFEIMTGSIFGIVGKNGSGKSTTLRMAAGICPPSAGTLLFWGQPARPSEQGRTLGYLPENPRFPGFLTGREVVQFHARLCGLWGATAASCVERALDWTGLNRVADSRSSTYSRGTLQRLGIAQACVHLPELLILDEPTAGLDRRAIQEFLALVVQLKRLGVTVVLSLHDLADVVEVCDQVAIMDQGSLIALGSPLDVFCCTRLLSVLIEPGGTDLVEDLRAWLEGRERQLCFSETVFSPSKGMAGEPVGFSPLRRCSGPVGLVNTEG